MVNPLRALVAFASLLVAPLPALATPQPTGIHFSWARQLGAQECPDNATVRQAVVRRLAYDPFVGSYRRRVDAFIEPNDHNWRVNVYVRDQEGWPRGSRELPALPGDCATATEAAAEVIANLILSTASDDTRAEPSVTARAVVVGELLPHLAWGGSLRAEATFAGPFRWMAEAVLLPPAEAPAGPGAIASGFLGASLGVCARAVPSPRVHLLGCAGALVGAITSDIRGGELEGPRTRAWGAAHVGATVRALLVTRGFSQLAVEAGGQAWVPFSPVAYAAPGGGPTYFEPWPVALVGSLGVGVSFR